MGKHFQLEKLTINGSNQSILTIRSNPKKPVLLFLHGGPGISEMVFAHHNNDNLLKNFNVVHWDQRGAGKSFSNKIDPETMNIEQFVDDGVAVIEHIRKKFKQKKIILVGHSWGSILGLKLALKKPKYIKAFVGISQLVNMQASEERSYRNVLLRAKKLNNLKAIHELESLSLPECFVNNSINYLEIERKWLEILIGLGYYGKVTDRFFVFIEGIKSPVYSFIDTLKWLFGARFSLKHMWPEIMKVNFFEGIRTLKVPVYFIMGKYDYIAWPKLVRQFYRRVKSPKKDFLLFEYSGHCPHIEEREKFDDFLIKTFS